MNLTPAQKRLITEARTRENNRIMLFGIPEKTKQKLIDVGLVEMVSMYSDAEKDELKAQIRGEWRKLDECLSETSPKEYHTGLAARNIVLLTTRLFATQRVLTDLGKTIDLEAD